LGSNDARRNGDRRFARRNGNGGRADAVVLHVADRHLGSTELAGEEEECFVRMIDLAIEQRVDGVLIAGDLFDSARVPRSLVEWTAAQLARLDRDVVILPGNHDALGSDSPYRLHPLDEMAARVRVITAVDGEEISLCDGRIRVWGRPVVDHAPWFRPLAGLPPRPDEGYAVVIAHGLVVEEVETVRGSPIYRSELDQVDWDYVALGHWPRFRHVSDSPPTVYAGEFDAVIVRLSESSVDVARLPLKE
jgi:DNA repair exonuclease SbcCD nuclease subunit